MRAKNEIEERILEFIIHRASKLYSKYFEMNFEYAFQEFGAHNFNNLIQELKPVIFPSVKFKEQKFVVEMIGTKLEKRIYKAASIIFLPLSITGLIIAAYIFKNYLFLLGILIGPIVYLLYDYLRPIIHLILFAGTIETIALIGTNHNDFQIFIGFISVALLGFYLPRKICVNLMLEKTMKSEVIFSFLYTFGFVSCMMKEKNGDLISIKFGKSERIKRP